MLRQRESIFFFLDQRGHKHSQSPGRRKKQGDSWFQNNGRKLWERGRKKSVCWSEREKREKRGGLLRGGHFGFHLSPWRRAPGPQKPLGRTNCSRGARYFLQHHLSLSPHNDSPRSSLLMFVIALSHKGGWSMEPRGASRGQEMSHRCLSI